jgi:hypothetical protein
MNMANPTGNWYPRGNDQNRLTQQLSSALQQLQAAAQELTDITNVMAQMTGGGGSTAVIETYFSLAAGSGAAVESLVSSAATYLNEGASEALIQQMG